MLRRMGHIAATVLALICLAVPPAVSSPYSAPCVIGDSLSDVGNIYPATGGALPASPHVDGQFSNGPIWAQRLSGSLGLGALQPALAGGTNFAFGLATTGNPSTASTIVPTLTQQIGMFLPTIGGSVPPTAIYTIWIGGNDLFNILSSGVPVPVALTGAEPVCSAEPAATGTAIGRLKFTGNTGRPDLRPVAAIVPIFRGWS